MAEFYFSARTESGKRVAGKVEAESQSAALQSLSQQYALVTRIEQKLERRNLFFLSKGIHGEDLLNFAQTLAAMLEGGIPVKRALDVIYGDTESRMMRSVIMDISSRVGGGSPLSDALAAHFTVFGEFFVKMVKAGESSGELPEMLRRIADYIEKMEALKDKVKGALTYPLVVISFALILLFCILTFGIPYLRDLYDGLGMTLPLATQILVAVGSFLHSHVLLLTLGLTIALYALRVWSLSLQGKKIIDGWKLRLPLLGEFFLLLYTARFARTLALLYASGVPLLQAIEMTGQSVGNLAVAEASTQVQKAIEAGDALSDSLRANPYFLDAAIGMVAAGEESGRLELMLAKVATFYEHKVTVKLQALTSVVEPLIMIGVGTVIGVMIVALGMPFLNLASAF